MKAICLSSDGCFTTINLHWGLSSTIWAEYKSTWSSSLSFRFLRYGKAAHISSNSKLFLTFFESIGTFVKETFSIFPAIFLRGLNHDSQSLFWKHRYLSIESRNSTDNILYIGKNYFTASLSPVFREFKSAFSVRWNFSDISLLPRYICAVFETPNIPNSLSQKFVLIHTFLISEDCTHSCTVIFEAHKRQEARNF